MAPRINNECFEFRRNAFQLIASTSKDPDELRVFHDLIQGHLVGCNECREWILVATSPVTDKQERLLGRIEEMLRLVREDGELSEEVFEALLLLRAMRRR